MFALLLPGCGWLWGSYGANGQSREEFEHYVEEVFRLQNSLTSEVMMLQESDELSDSERVLQAEQQMRQQCDSLNEYVARDADGQDSGFILRQRVEKTAGDCERAAQALELLLK
jgi:hypothetical protein